MLSRLLFLSACLSAVVSAHCVVRQIVINKGMADDATIEFSQFSRIDIRDGKLIFNTDDPLAIALSSVSTLHFDDGTYSGTVTSAISGISVRVEGNMLHVDGLSSNETVEVYALTGQKVLTSQSASTDVSGLAQGVYLVKAGNEAFKVKI